MAVGADPSVVYSGQVDRVLEAADVSLEDPRSLDLIYDLALTAGVDRRSLVVDVGCATGERGRELIGRSGCRVEGIELLPHLVEWGQAATEAADLADRMRIRRGSILDLPLQNGYADFVLCTDVLGLIEDLPRAVSECARILKPGGSVVAHVTVATDRMAEWEQAELDASQGTVAASMNRANLERTLRTHFDIEETVELGAEHRLAAIEGGNDETLTNLIRAARLMTWPDGYRAQHGDVACGAALTEALWGVYQLLGKLSPVIYLLRRVR